MRCSTWPASMPTTKRCACSDAVAGFPSRREMPVAESNRVIRGQIAFLRGKDSRYLSNDLTEVVHECASAVVLMGVNRLH